MIQRKQLTTESSSAVGDLEVPVVVVPGESDYNWKHVDLLAHVPQWPCFTGSHRVGPIYTSINYAIRQPNYQALALSIY